MYIVLYTECKTTKKLKKSVCLCVSYRFILLIPCFPSKKGPMSSCSGKLMKVLSFFLWPVCLEKTYKFSQCLTPMASVFHLFYQFCVHFYRAVSVPIEDEAHELQVECWGEAVQLDPAGGVLFTLTALTEVTVVSIQLLLLKGDVNIFRHGT